MGWPSCFYGPNGEAEVFASAEDVPAGWADHPSKVAKPADPFDHDGDGKAGGSRPRKKAAPKG